MLFSIACKNCSQSINKSINQSRITVLSVLSKKSTSGTMFVEGTFKRYVIVCSAKNGESFYVDVKLQTLEDYCKFGTSIR